MNRIHFARLPFSRLGVDLAIVRSICRPKNRLSLRKKNKVLKLSKENKQSAFRLINLQRKAPNLFVSVTRLLNAKEFLKLMLGNKDFYKTINGSLQKLKNHLNEEFVTNFSNYFITNPHFPQFPFKEFVLEYFKHFCTLFGTELCTNWTWGRDRNAPNKIVMYAPMTPLEWRVTLILENGELVLMMSRYPWLATSYREKTKFQDNRIPCLVEQRGKFTKFDCNFNRSRKKVGNVYIQKPPVLPLGVTIISYITPQNFQAYIRKLPFAN